MCLCYLLILYIVIGWCKKMQASISQLEFSVKVNLLAATNPAVLCHALFFKIPCWNTVKKEIFWQCFLSACKVLYCTKYKLYSAYMHTDQQRVYCERLSLFLFFLFLQSYIIRLRPRFTAGWWQWCTGAWSPLELSLPARPVTGARLAGTFRLFVVLPIKWCQLSEWAGLCLSWHSDYP